MSKGTNLGVEKRSGNDELDAVAEFEAQEQALRDEPIAEDQTGEDKEFGAVFKEDKRVFRTASESETLKFSGYTVMAFPEAEDESISLYECFVPTSDKDKNGRTYTDFLRKYENDYELRMFGQVWRWSADKYEREEKVIFRKTVAYILRSVATDRNYLFVPKTNQLFPLF